MLNFPFKIQFLRIFKIKNRYFALWGFLIYFLCSGYMFTVYQNALIPRKLPCPKKFLVMHLKIDAFTLTQKCNIKTSTTQMPMAHILTVKITKAILYLVTVFKKVFRNRWFHCMAKSFLNLKVQVWLYKVNFSYPIHSKNWYKTIRHCLYIVKINIIVAYAPTSMNSEKDLNCRDDFYDQLDHLTMKHNGANTYC